MKWINLYNKLSNPVYHQRVVTTIKEASRITLEINGKQKVPRKPSTYAPPTPNREDITETCKGASCLTAACTTYTGALKKSSIWVTTIDSSYLTTNNDRSCKHTDRHTLKQVQPTTSADLLVLGRMIGWRCSGQCKIQPIRSTGSSALGHLIGLRKLSVQSNLSDQPALQPWVIWLVEDAQASVISNHVKWPFDLRASDWPMEVQVVSNSTNHINWPFSLGLFDWFRQTLNIVQTNSKITIIIMKSHTLPLTDACKQQSTTMKSLSTHTHTKVSLLIHESSQSGMS